MPALAAALLLVLSPWQAIKAFEGHSAWDEVATPYLRHLTTKDLPGVATAVVQDNAGFIWIGTQDGLVRWDGYRPRTFRHQPNDPTSLPGNLVTALIADDRGLLVAVSTGILARYDSRTESFTALPPTATGTAVYSALAEDTENGLWFGNANGLSYLPPGGDKWESIPLPDHRRVWGLAYSRNGTLWAGTNAGPLRWDRDSHSFVEFGTDSALTSANIRSLTETSDGEIWFGTNDGRVGTWTADGKVRFADMPQPSDAIYSVEEVQKGVIGAAGVGCGLVLLDQHTGKLVRALKFDPLRPTGLSDDFIFTLYRDRSGGLWIGNLKGADYAPASDGTIDSLLPSEHAISGLSDSHISAIGRQEGGTIWIGTENGADALTQADGHIRIIRQKSGSGPLLALTLINAITASDNGTTWFATGRGLYRYQDGRLQRFPGIPDTPVRSLLAEGQTLWVGLERTGLARIDLSTGAITYYEHVADDPHSISDNYVLGLLRDPKHGLWVGTQHGLNLFDGEKFYRFAHDPTDPNSLPSDVAITLLLDQQQRLWVGTHSGGIGILEGDPKGEHRFLHLSRANGLPNDNIGMFLADDKGIVWASTDMGIAQIDPSNLAIHAFTEADGLSVSASYVNSGIKASDGTLLFGGLGGVTIVHPDRAAKWGYVPEVAPTTIRIGGATVPTDRSLTISPDKNNLQVEFSALDYSAPEKNRYAYKLEGFDKDWITTDSDHRLAAYTNLPPGSYTLLLRGSNRAGAWTDPPTRLTVMVLPAWYQTIWTKIALVLVAAASIAGLVRSRTALLRRRQKELEGQVAERTSEIASLLHNSGEGFLSFGPDLVIDRQCSRACETFLGEPPAGKNAGILLFAEHPRQAAFLAESVPSALNAATLDKQSLILSLLPKEIDRRGRRLKLHYAVLENGHLMVVLRDVTTERRLAERVASEHRRLGLIVAAVTDSRDFFDLVSSFNAFANTGIAACLRSHADPDEALKELFRQIHTFKGEFNQFSFEKMPEALHELEGELDELRRTHADISREDLETIVSPRDVLALLDQDLAVVRKALGEDFLSKGGLVTMTPDQAMRIKKLVELWRQGAPIDLNDPTVRNLLDEIDRVGTVSLKNELASFDQTVAQVALRLEKEVAPLSVDGDDIWIDPNIFGPFLRSLIHVFRNCVTHGIEPPDRRLGDGKEEYGRIRCEVRRDGDHLDLIIADDGAGIDVAKLRTQLVTLGHCDAEAAAAMADHEIAAYIFRDQITTAEEADQWAGRGVGLAAVQKEVEALGGRVVVETVLGQGTRFLFRLELRRSAVTQVA